MIRCVDCEDTVVCHHCRWFYDALYWCSKHNRGTYPSDTCEDYTCEDYTCKESTCKESTYDDIRFRYSFTASTGGLTYGL